jgi:DNA-3-methyladenine glycosylase II
MMAGTHALSLPYSTALKLKAVPPYDFVLTVHKPAGWSLLTPFEVFSKGTLWTATRTPVGDMFGLKLRSLGTVEEPEISCRAYSHRKLEADEKKELRETVEWMLNLREDITEFYALAEHDMLVNALVKDLYGMRQTKQPDIFPRVILAVTLQMAPISRSNQMMNLLIKEYGDKIEFDNREIYYWPSVEKIARAKIEDLEKKCKLGYRAKILKGIAETLHRGFPAPRDLEQMPTQEAKSKLMELKGIGEYSADIISPHPGFALDVWSARIFSMLILGHEPRSSRKSIPRLRKMAENRWGNWRSYVFTYVLHDLDNLSRKFNLNLTHSP